MRGLQLLLLDFAEMHFNFVRNIEEEQPGTHEQLLRAAHLIHCPVPFRAVQDKGRFVELTSAQKDPKVDVPQGYIHAVAHGSGVGDADH